MPCARWPTLPETDARICTTWLAPIAVSGAKPLSTIIGTDSAGPPTPVSPEPKPVSAPMPNSSARRCRGRPSKAVRRRAPPPSSV